jgi:hypothetical protein
MIVVGLAGVTWWAFLPRPDLPLRTTGVDASSAIPVVPQFVIDPQVFRISLWRPFVDRPVGPGTSDVPPPAVKLFSIFKRQGQHVAALEIGGTESLVYLAAGQTQGLIQVVSIDAATVSLLVAGKSQRLSLSP